VDRRTSQTMKGLRLRMRICRLNNNDWLGGSEILEAKDGLPWFRVHVYQGMIDDIPDF
jgi:hypothetical protein